MKRKVIITVLLIVSILVLNVNSVYATVKGKTSTSDKDTTSSTINTNNFEPDALTKEDYGEAFNKASTIVSVLTTIGVVVSIVVVMGLGIKYMTGSVEQKAEYKRTMIPMIVGAVLIFGTSTIVSVIYNLVSQVK